MPVHLLPRDAVGLGGLFQCEQRHLSGGPPSYVVTLQTALDRRICVRGAGLRRGVGLRVECIAWRSEHSTRYLIEGEIRMPENMQRSESGERAQHNRDVNRLISFGLAAVCTAALIQFTSIDAEAFERTGRLFLPAFCFAAALPFLVVHGLVTHAWFDAPVSRRRRTLYTLLIVFPGWLFALLGVSFLVSHFGDAYQRIFILASVTAGMFLATVFIEQWLYRRRARAADVQAQRNDPDLHA